MKRHLKYARYVFLHKWYVFVECCKLGIPLLGIIHDWSKFKPSEWRGFARRFYGDDRLLWDAALNEHLKHNKHHPEYWILVERNDKPEWTVTEHAPQTGLMLSRCNKAIMREFETSLPEDVVTYRLINGMRDRLNMSIKPLPMPDRYRREMLADWRGFGRAIGKPDVREWYLSVRSRLNLHPETCAWIEQQLGVKQ